MAQRAKWTSRFEKGLVDVLSDYKTSHYRGQNGWCSEGWRRIVKDFNQLFPEARFSKAQIQDKEAQLKKDFKAIKSILKRSGVNWLHDASMINTTTEIWDEIRDEDSRLGRYEKKSFPLYNSLELLYEGKHCFTSGKPQHATSKGFEGKGAQKTLLDFSKQNPWATTIEVRARPPVGDDEVMSSPRRAEDYETTDLDNEHSHFKGNKKRSHQMMESSERQGMEAEQNDLSDSDEDMGHQSDDNTSSRSATARSNRGRLKKSKDKKPVPPIEESLSEFVSLRKQQAVAKDMVKKQGQEFSVTRCLAVLNAMDVSDELKIGASDVFKDAVNREIFLGYDSKLRGLWLRKEVNKLGTQHFQIWVKVEEVLAPNRLLCSFLLVIVDLSESLEIQVSDS